MSGVRHVTVGPQDDGQRLDRWLKNYVSFALAQKLIRTGQVRVDGKRAKGDTRLTAGQSVRLPPVSDQPEKTHKIIPLTEKDKSFIASLVVYDDGDIVALDKPAGLAAQGGGRERLHADRLAEALADKEGLVPRLIHRLDKETSGILLLARRPDTIRALGKAFRDRQARKTYHALVAPAPARNDGVISALISKVKGPIKDKMTLAGTADDPEARLAETEFSVVARAGKRAAHVAFNPLTGRTHQIRVHAAEALECPILGDGRYGGNAEWMEEMGMKPRLHLHAARLSVPRPGGKGRLALFAPLPPDLAASWAALGFDTDVSRDPWG